jgi:methyl-accepting chemotaxis protein
MRVWNDLKVRSKLLIVIPSIALILIVSLVSVSVTSLRALGTEILRTNASYLATLAAETIKASIQYDVEDDSNRIIEGLVGNGSDVSLAAVILQDPKDAFSIKKAMTAKDSADLDLQVFLKELASSPPTLQGPPVFLSSSRLEIAAAKIDLTANGVLKNGFILVGLSQAKLNRELVKTTSLMLMIGAVIIILGIVLTFLVATSLTKPLKAAVSTAVELAKGDLAYKIDPKALLPKDEVGGLIRAMKQMQGDLTVSVGRIDAVSGSLGKVGDRLGQTITETAESAKMIGEAIGQVNDRVENQAASVTETSATIHQIVRNIEGLNQDIDNQASAVTQSSASIEEMLSNIQSVTKNVEQMGEEFTRLLGASDNGKAKLNTVTDRIRAVSGQSQKLREANGVIENIASQTNLLAMNAAIEAAHAGSSGRGFAVVADEIRKLAEQSAQQSSEIGKDIAQIMKEITLVVSAAGESEQAFGLILEKISVLNRYEQEIKQSMVEQNEGSRQILEAIAQINDITSHVKNNAGEITEGSRSIRTEMQNLASGSEELNTSMHRIDEGTQRIQRTSSQLEQIGRQTAEQIATLADVVSQFKL